VKPLTHQQEAFAQAVAAGKSQAEAYRIAYPKSLSWKPEALHPQASRMIADPKIAARVAAIKQELEKAGLWSREQSVKVLAEIASRGEKDADRVRAVAELNKMHGFEAETKIQHSGNVAVAVYLPDNGRDR
jgi:phage terminase small subunit